jgi:hypothetical protein
MISAPDTVAADQVRETFRRVQLVTMGLVAIGLAPVVVLFTTVVHRLPMPQSISETATMANQVGPILPFCLGALALFALTYGIVSRYTRLDTVFTTGICLGFTVVAFQMCASPYVTTQRVGVFALSPGASNVVHYIGATIGFACLILWVMVCFTKSNRPKAQRGQRKRWRDRVYLTLGSATSLALVVLLADAAGWLPTDFPTPLVAEAIILAFLGAACCVKGGLVLKDRVA